MINKKDILKELEKKFEESQKRIGFKPSYEEIEKEFAISDAVLSNGFVSENFERQLTSRIAEFYRDWHGYLNNLLLPNPSYYAGQTESKLFNSEEDKKKIWDLVTISMKFSSMHSLSALNKDEKLQKEFIDTAYESWIGIFKPGIVHI